MSQPPPNKYRISKAYLITELILCAILIPLFGIGLILMIAALIQYRVKSLTVEDSKVVLKDGFLTVRTTEIPYAKINGVQLEQSLDAKWMDYGTIIIVVGNDVAGIKFSQVERPHQLKNALDAKRVDTGSPARPNNAAPSLADELEKLASLKDKGIITTEEFAAQKQRILNS